MKFMAERHDPHLTFVINLQKTNLTSCSGFTFIRHAMSHQLTYALIGKIKFKVHDV